MVGGLSDLKDLVGTVGQQAGAAEAASLATRRAAEDAAEKGFAIGRRVDEALADMGRFRRDLVEQHKIQSLIAQNLLTRLANARPEQAVKHVLDPLQPPAPRPGAMAEVRRLYLGSNLAPPPPSSQQQQRQRRQQQQQQHQQHQQQEEAAILPMPPAFAAAAASTGALDPLSAPQPQQQQAHFLPMPPAFAAAASTLPAPQQAPGVAGATGAGGGVVDLTMSDSDNQVGTLPVNDDMTSSLTRI